MDWQHPAISVFIMIINNCSFYYYYYCYYHYYCLLLIIGPRGLRRLLHGLPARVLGAAAGDQGAALMVIVVILSTNKQSSNNYDNSNINDSSTNNKSFINHINDSISSTSNTDIDRCSAETSQPYTERARLKGVRVLGHRLATHLFRVAYQEVPNR